MRDFTLVIYKKLLAGLTKANYKFVTFAEFVQEPNKKEKAIILRHDVDKRPLRSLRTAKIEHGLGIKGTYYFRVEKDELPAEVIRRIAKMGHEIGYHYDDLNVAGGDEAKALEFFQKNLVRLRESAIVKTVCMHGSPLSKYDNRDLWKKNNYHDFGIVGEPYFDLDFSKVLYLTDTGRRWDGGKSNIRDKVTSNGRGVWGEGEYVKQKIESKGQQENDSMDRVYAQSAFHIHSTKDIIDILEEGRLLNNVMLTIHPQRWTDDLFPWTQELVLQSMKNVIKYFLVSGRSQYFAGREKKGYK